MFPREDSKKKKKGEVTWNNKKCTGFIEKKRGWIIAYAIE